MRDMLQQNAREVSALQKESVLDYRGVVEPILPVREESVTQLGPGPSEVDVSIVSSNDVHLLRARVHAASVGVTVLDAAYVAFVSWAGADECLINGESAQPTHLYMTGKGDSFHIVGGRRDTIGVAFPRESLVATLAALRGEGPEDVVLDAAVLEMTANVGLSIRKRLVEQAEERSADPEENSAAGRRGVAEDLFGLLADAYLRARPEAPRRSSAKLPTRVVRKAEERYFAAEGGAVSLADLCLAAGVSQAALYRAFRLVCGEPPVAYFRKRSLSRARTALLRSRPERGAVKRAALDAGFTELGRFSVEYRRLFGESPSTTLARAGTW
jgi:AraC-like DNA-binding protein